MKAIKDNKVYRIGPGDAKRYLNDGYDIYDDDGKLAEHSPLKKMTYSEHEKIMRELKAENEELKAKSEELKNKIKTLEAAKDEKEQKTDKKETAKKAGE